MGRVYEADAIHGPTGQHGLHGPVHVLTNTGRPVANVVRVEFDEDADHGMATVTAFATAADGQPVTYRDDAGDPAMPEVTFRASVRLVPR